MKKKFGIYFLGCKINQYEIEAVKEQFINNGWILSKNWEKADVYIVNTCTVTERSSSKSRQLIRKLHKINPEAEIIVTGCAAQEDAEDMYNIEGVKLVVGNDKKSKILEYIETDQKGIILENINEINDFEKLEVYNYGEKSRAFIKIQDGCDNYCSYCIVPYLRGKSRSNSPEIIIKQIKSLINKGYYEFVLAGIHLGKYGQDFPKKYILSDLIKDILQIENFGRLRLSSIEINEINDDIIKLITESEKFCKHLHIPLQNGSDEILKLMNRKSTTKEYSEKINFLKSKIKNIAIGTDIIVGFPGESDKNFQETLDFVKANPIDFFHIFRYSEKKGTKAEKIFPKVPERIAKERAKILSELAYEKNKNFLYSNLNNILNVVFENRSRDGYLIGISSNYIKILVKNPKKEINYQKEYLIKPLQVDDNNLYILGEIIE